MYISWEIPPFTGKTEGIYMSLKKQIANKCPVSMDLRVQKTLQVIEQTFFQLLLEKDLTKITVTELCKRAKILRKTFYSHSH